MNRHADGLLKEHFKVRRAHIGNVCNFTEREIMRETLLNVIQDALQA